MKSFLLNIIADPVTNETLVAEGDTALINPANGKQYQVMGEIPNFVSGLSATGHDNGGQEATMGDFDYRRHYETDARQFDYFATEEHSITRNERRRSRESIIHSVPSSAQLILDIGCGNAWVAAHFLGKGRQVISMDISTSNPQKALEAYPHPNHAALVADAFFLPFKNNSLDCIIASEVLEHLTDPSAFIDKVTSKLKPGGKLIMVTPYNEKLEYYLCVHCNKPTPKSSHLHSFNEQNIRNYIHGTDLSVTTRAFCNKLLLKLRLYNLLSFLPYQVWELVDSLANGISRKPLTFRIEITKST